MDSFVPFFVLGAVLAGVRLFTRHWIAEQRRRAGVIVGPTSGRGARHTAEAIRLRAELDRLEEEARRVIVGSSARPPRVRPELFGPTFSEADFLAFAGEIFRRAQAARWGHDWSSLGVRVEEAAREFLTAGPPLTDAPRVRAVEATLSETHADDRWRVASIQFDALADEPRTSGPFQVRVRETWRFRLRADRDVPASPQPGDDAGWEVLSIPDGERSALTAPRSPLPPAAEIPDPMAGLAERCGSLGIDLDELLAAARALLPAVLRGEPAEAAGPMAAALERDALEDQALGVRRALESIEIQEVRLIRARGDRDGVIAEIGMKFQARGWVQDEAGAVITGDSAHPAPASGVFALRRVTGEGWKVWGRG